MILVMCEALAASENPIMLAELTTFTKGKSLSNPSVAATAVLPLPDAPSRRHVNKFVLSLVFTCAKGRTPDFTANAKAEYCREIDSPWQHVLQIASF
jgi:hypothetical protein